MNNTIKVEFTRRGEQLLAFVDNAMYGEQLHCSQEDFVKGLQAQRSPSYWSEELRAWTYPGLSSFKDAQEGKYDWIEVQTIIKSEKV